MSLTTIIIFTIYKLVAIPTYQYPRSTRTYQQLVKKLRSTQYLYIFIYIELYAYQMFVKCKYRPVIITVFCFIEIFFIK